MAMGPTCFCISSINVSVLQVYNEVVSRRAHTAVVYVFLGFLNVIGTVGGLLLYGAVVSEELNPLQPQPVGDTTQHIQVATSFIFTQKL